MNLRRNRFSRRGYQTKYAGQERVGTVRKLSAAEIAELQACVDSAHGRPVKPIRLPEPDHERLPDDFEVRGIWR